VAPFLENFPKASFDGIAFPFSSRTAHGEFRHFVHEYPDMAAGSVEKHGRKTWRFTFEAHFHTTFLNFPGLYPDSLNALTERYERGDTAVLLISEIGEIRALITRLERRRKGSILSGEDATLEFLEDDLEPFRRTKAPEARSALVEAQAAILRQLLLDRPQVEAKIPEAAKRLGPMLNLLDSILALRDQVNLFGLQVAGKLNQLGRIVREVHGLLKGPDFDPLRIALRDLWYAAKRLHDDVGSKGPQNVLVFRTTAARMTVSQIAQWAYKDASRGGEVLALNSQIVDPYGVPAGTRLRLYAA
jgi:hypothetical protein